MKIKIKKNPVRLRDILFSDFDFFLPYQQKKQDGPVYTIVNHCEFESHIHYSQLRSTITI